MKILYPENSILRTRLDYAYDGIKLTLNTEDAYLSGDIVGTYSSKMILPI